MIGTIVVAASLSISCSGGGDTPTAAGAIPMQSTLVATDVTAPTATERPLRTLDGLIVGAPLRTAANVALVASASTFLRFTTSQNRVVVEESSDGVKWGRVDSNLPTMSVHSAAGADQRVVVAGWSAEDGPRFWESVDVGRSWTELPRVPVAQPARVDMHRSPLITGLAIIEDRVIALVQDYVVADWRAYAMDTLGTDHGASKGVSTGSGTGAVEIEFEDGYRLTIDPASLDLSNQELVHYSGPLIAYSYDGTVWVRTELPWGEGRRNNLVNGPAGVAALVGEQADQLALSADGVTWSVQPVPHSFEWPSIAGGPLGYAIAGEASVIFSPDGTSWETVHQFDDFDSSTFGWMPDAGGAGGFVFVDNQQPSGRSTRILSSTDGRGWRETTLEYAEAFEHFARAVNSNVALLIPVVAPPG